MHELAIAQGIVESAAEELRKIVQPVVVKRVSVAIGQLHQVVEDFLQTAFRAVARGTEFENTTLEIRFVPVTARCRCCGWRGELELPLFVCRQCGAYDVDVLTGKELHLEKMEIEGYGDHTCVQRSDGRE